MQHMTGSFTNSGLKIYTAVWLPDTPAKAAVVLVHGVAEHIHRYEHVAKFLVERGYAVYGLDHRGHGRSEGERTYFETFNQPVMDLKVYVDQVKAKHDKVFMYGHSMGSLISLMYALRYPNDLTGLISSATPLDGENAVPPAVAFVGKVLEKIIPKLHFLALDSGTLSRDPTVVANYDNDPLVDRKPMRIGTGVRMGASATAVKARLSELKIPMLVFHGDADKLTPPSGSQFLYQNAGAVDKTLKMYPGLFHESHNEPEQAQVLGDIADWLDKHG